MDGGDGADQLHAHSGEGTYYTVRGSAEIEVYLGHDVLDGSERWGNDHIDLSGEIEGHIIQITSSGTTSAPLDVQFLQDRSGSFADYTANVRGLVPQIGTTLQTIQVNSAFGVPSFIDKAVSPFGAAGEWVYQQHLALRADVAALTTTWNAFNTPSGANCPLCGSAYRCDLPHRKGCRLWR